MGNSVQNTDNKIQNLSTKLVDLGIALRTKKITQEDHDLQAETIREQMTQIQVAPESEPWDKRMTVLAREVITGERES